jgi:hypothetical protein
MALRYLQAKIDYMNCAAYWCTLFESRIFTQIEEGLPSLQLSHMI